MDLFKHSAADPASPLPAPAAPKRKKRWIKWIIIALIAVLAAALILRACLPQNQNRQAMSEMVYQYETVSRRDITDELSYSGTPYTVVGVLSEISDSTDESGSDNLVLIPYTNAAKMSFMGSISSYTFNAADEDSVTAAKAAIESALYEFYQDDSAYTVVAMSEMLDTMNQMIDILVTVLAGIAAISLVVGGVGIMNIMLVSVSERTREIGIRKSLGARQRDILFQFVIEAGVTSAIGGILGILFGYLLSAAATAVIATAMQVDMTVAPTAGSILMAFGISVAIGVVFGYLPARKAARLNPIDALHYD